MFSHVAWFGGRSCITSERVFVLASDFGELVERAEQAKQALQVESVVEVHEIMTRRENIEVKGVAPRNDDVTRIAETLHELGLTIETEDLIRRHYYRPFNHFGTADVSGAVNGTYEV